jgi:hypothetical protein
MSHVTTVDVEIRDLEAVKDICKELGLEFKENQRSYRWYGTHVGDYPLPEGFTKSDLGRCDHAIGVKGASSKSYEIGLVKRGEVYIPLFDFWQGGFGLEERIGPGAKKFTDAYTRAVSIKTAKAFAKSKGFSYTEKLDPETQETILVMRKY